jgi:hypothetical protein
MSTIQMLEEQQERENSKKYLKLEDLENGKFYKCRLSGKQVLLNVATWDAQNRPTSWNIKYFSDESGFYQTDFPVDYQLSEI